MKIACGVLHGGRLRTALMSCVYALPVFCLVLELLYGTSPTDAAMFRYLGWNMSTGGDYFTAWDCKGPVLHFLEAIGYWVAPASHYGPSFVFCFIWLAVVHFFGRVARAYDARCMVVATASFAFLEFGVIMLRAWNCQEAAALFFALSAVWVAISGRAHWRSLVVGLCGGCVFLIKPNLCSFGLGIGAYWLAQTVQTKNWKTFWANIALAGGAFVAFLTAVSAWYGTKGAYAMWDANLLYNLLERTNGITQSWGAWWISFLFKELDYGTFDPWLLWVWFVAAPFVVWEFVRRIRHDGSPLAWLLLTWFVFESAMTFVSKGYYTHYLMLTLVAFCLALGSAVVRCRGRTVCTVLLCLSLGCVVWEYPKAVYQMAVSSKVHAESYRGMAELLPPGTKVAASGLLGTAEAMGRLRLRSPQRYFDWLMWIGHCSDKRRTEMLDGFQKALEDESVEWWLSDKPSEAICEKAKRAEITAAIAGFELYRKCECPYVYFYRRKGK